MIRLHVRTQFDAQKLQRKTQSATFRSLGHAGAAIRLTARRSIRRRKKPSRPGSPPHTQSGHMKRVFRYEVSSNKTEVFIGPVNEFAGTIWNLHEFGGRAKGRRLLKTHRFQVGEYGPIRVKQRGYNAKFARIRLKTPAQASRATRLIEEENARRQKEVRNYPRRPFMKPALDVNRSRLPKFWANSVN